MADFSNPKNANPLLSFLGYIRDCFTSVAKMFDGTTDSNVPVGAKKIDGSTKVVSQWNGASWDAIGSVAALTAVNADSIAVSNLETDNFKSGIIVTTVGVTGADDKIPTEQAVREAIAAIPSPVPANKTTETLTLEGFDGTTTSKLGYSYVIGKLHVMMVYLQIATVGTSSANAIRISGFSSIGTSFRMIGTCQCDTLADLHTEISSLGTELKVLKTGGAYATYGDIGTSLIRGTLITFIT